MRREIGEKKKSLRERKEVACSRRFQERKRKF